MSSVEQRFKEYLDRLGEEIERLGGEVRVAVGVDRNVMTVEMWKRNGSVLPYEFLQLSDLGADLSYIMTGKRDTSAAVPIDGELLQRIYDITVGETEKAGWLYLVPERAMPIISDIYNCLHLVDASKHSDSFIAAFVRLYVRGAVRSSLIETVRPEDEDASDDH